QLTKDEGAELPLASTVLSRQIYIDNCLFGADSREEILKIREEMKTLLNRGKFQLRKWASNSASLNEDIDATDHGLAIEKPFREDDSLKILGILWVPAQDTYRYHIQPFENSIVTKRSVLSVIARLYDPLGWVSPVIIVAKVFMQKLWMNSVSWYETLPQELSDVWQSYCEELLILRQCSIPRWTGQGFEVMCSTIQGFSDASNTAYAAVVYLRLVLPSGEIQITLLSSKTKVAPLKTLSIPRLELSGALLLTQLVSVIRSNPEFRTLNALFWTDSTIVLAWLKKHPSSWSIFLENRVASIQSVAPIESWGHVSSEDNPADLASRGAKPSELMENKLWWKGPWWLSQSRNLWPDSQTLFDSDTTEEVRENAHCVTEVRCTWFDRLTSRVSSWLKLLKIVAYVLKFLALRRLSNRKKQDSESDSSLSEYCSEAEGVCVRLVHG
ncbi:uncharacterized protein LOC117182529, partial [Belonocnema kinseyi]|uniref:uncharacterized protein LOC117182529 n=1 Tax=Belonocnema kinseyi TaxID=2817044 RepID=UPI00143D99A4